MQTLLPCWCGRNVIANLDQLKPRFQTSLSLNLGQKDLGLGSGFRIWANPVLNCTTSNNPTTLLHWTQSGSLVHPMVLRQGRTFDRIAMTLEPTSPWTHNPWVRQPLGPPTPGSANPWVRQPLGLPTPGSANPWVRQPLGPPTPGSANPWVHQPLGPPTPGSTNPWVHWTLDPLVPGFTAPGSSEAPGSTGAITAKLSKGQSEAPRGAVQLAESLSSIGFCSYSHKCSSVGFLHCEIGFHRVEQILRRKKKGVQFNSQNQVWPVQSTHSNSRGNKTVQGRDGLQRCFPRDDVFSVVFFFLGGGGRT